jgi:hypothetical protein
LAATLYAVLSGHAPRWSETMEMPSIPEMIKRQKNPIKRIPGVDKGFMEVLLHAMAESPEDRPTASQFRDQLAALNLSTKLAPRPPEPKQEPPPSAPRIDAPRTDEEPVPVKAEPDPVDKAHRWEHRGLATLAIAAVLVALASGIALLNLFSPDEPAAAPTPIQSATSSAAIPTTTTPLLVPAGFVDCSEQLGTETYCASQPECWAGIQALSDIPALATKQDCDKLHVYQTFIAGRMTYELRRQSQLDSDAHIRRVCTTEIANSMLRSRERRSDWEILVLGPQQPNENYFRCIIGRGERTEPLTFQAPR